MIDHAAIRNAFSNRKKPGSVASGGEPDSLYEDARHFQELSWEEVTSADWANHSDAIYGMNADAFCYFLPSIMSLSLGGFDKVGMVGDSIIYSLDTSGDPDLWNTHFIERFCKLSAAELDALWNWTRGMDADHADALTLQRVHHTVNMLRLMKAAGDIGG